ncbi:hypothetical protein [Salibacterium lacus]|uniref:Uncharacterized protein n=1 Tax=Salibacterium lacus TaxID=1898109 RepID=A0ABW5T0F6_9BACI
MKISEYSDAISQGFTDEQIAKAAGMSEDELYDWKVGHGLIETPKPAPKKEKKEAEPVPENKEKPKLDKELYDKERAANKTNKQIAEEYGITTATLYARKREWTESDESDPEQLKEKFVAKSNKVMLDEVHEELKKVKAQRDDWQWKYGEAEAELQNNALEPVAPCLEEQWKDKYEQAKYECELAQGNRDHWRKLAEQWESHYQETKQVLREFQDAQQAAAEYAEPLKMETITAGPNQAKKHASQLALLLHEAYQEQQS